MFIDSATNSIARARAERNVSGNGTLGPAYVSLRWSEESLLEVARSINISPLMGRRGNNVLLHFKLECTISH